MQANRPDNFDDILHNASKQSEFNPNQRVWKGISTHFDRVERNRKIWHGSIFAAFTLICSISAIYFNNIPDAPLRTTISQLNGREIFDNKLSNQQHALSNNINFQSADKASSIYNNKQKIFDFSTELSNIVNSENNIELLSSIKQYSNLQFAETTNNIEPTLQYNPIRKLLNKPHKNNWQLGFSIGYSNNKAIGTANPDITLLSLNSIQIGSSIGYNITKNISINSGINLYKTGVSYYFPGMNTSAIVERKNITDIYSNSFWVAEIPLSINHNGTIKNNWGYTIGGGIAAQCKLPSHSNDGGYHIMNYGREINGVYLLNAKITKEFKNYKIALGATPKYQMLNTNHSGNYKLLQTSAELSIGFKL